jgi:RNA 2',3'-cyclic 3'-phosphodiesterase
MTDQLYFEGFEPAAKPATGISAPKKHKFFFALRPNDAAAYAAASALQELRRGQRLTGSVVKRENLHVTLFPFWECDEPPADLVEVASALVQAISAKPFEITFDMAMSFRRKGGFILVLGSTRGCAGLYDLQRRFVMRLSPRARVGSLTPHMTLMYPAQFVEKQPIDPIRWRADEFVLIDSWHGLGRHDIVGRWPLR